MKFTYPVYVPSLDEHVDSKELLNKHYIVILKYIANEDNTGLERYMTQLIAELCGLDTAKLNKIDKFCILLSLRITSIGPDVKLQLTCSKTGQEYGGTIDLYSVLQIVSDLQSCKTKTFRMCENTLAEIGMPSTLYYGGIETTTDTVTDVINSLIINDEKYDMSQLTLKEKNAVIDLLPGGNINKLIKHATNLQKKFDNVVIFKDKSPHDPESSMTEYKLGLYDNSMFEMIKLIYNTHINNYYTNMYTLCDTMGFTAEYIENITPTESHIYIQQKRQEIDRQKQQNQQDNQGPTIGAVPSRGNI